jgi:hypothetical protein
MIIIIELNNKYGLIDGITLEIILEPIYDNIYEKPNYYTIKLKDKIGIINKQTFKIILEPIYDNIWVYDDYYKIKLNDKYGLISKESNKVILNPEYNTYKCAELIKIYKSKMIIEKLRQLEEMI